MDEPTKKSMSQRKKQKAAENHRPFSSAFSGTRGRVARPRAMARGYFFKAVF
jgi:hypothetical protein